MTEEHMKRLILTLAFSAAVPVHVWAQNGWDDPFPAHRVMDNLYFVGTGGLGTFLITTPEGHILINTDFERTIPLIEQGIQAMGFDLADVRIILGSHAHGDHQAADVFLREHIGAMIMIMEEDVAGWQRMMRGDGEIPIDRVLHDGDKVTLGGTTLVAHRTPGHTRGCTSWGMEVEESGRTYNALVVCSFGVNANYILVDNPDYPDIAKDYRATFAKARAMPVDVFVASHGSFYDLRTKHETIQHREEGDPNPFLDHSGFLAYVDLQEQRFQAMLETQLRAARSDSDLGCRTLAVVHTQIEAR
jgi:metallo-beta-lactamase class B